jgi:hypothetical protein
MERVFLPSSLPPSLLVSLPPLPTSLPPFSSLPPFFSFCFLRLTPYLSIWKLRSVYSRVSKLVLSVARTFKRQALEGGSWGWTQRQVWNSVVWGTGNGFLRPKHSGRARKWQEVGKDSELSTYSPWRNFVVCAKELGSGETSNSLWRGGWIESRLSLLIHMIMWRIDW